MTSPDRTGTGRRPLRSRRGPRPAGTGSRPAGSRAPARGPGHRAARSSSQNASAKAIMFVTQTGRRRPAVGARLAAHRQASRRAGRERRSSPRWSGSARSRSTAARGLAGQATRVGDQQRQEQRDSSGTRDPGVRRAARSAVPVAPARSPRDRGGRRVARVARVCAGPDPRVTGPPQAEGGVRPWRTPGHRGGQELLVNAASNAAVGGSKASRRTNSSASGAPTSRSMPGVLPLDRDRARRSRWC